MKKQIFLFFFWLTAGCAIAWPLTDFRTAVVLFLGVVVLAIYGIFSRQIIIKDGKFFIPDEKKKQTEKLNSPQS